MALRRDPSSAPYRPRDQRDLIRCTACGDYFDEADIDSQGKCLYCHTTNDNEVNEHDET